jgi:Receptor family ligand binding region
MGFAVVMASHLLTWQTLLSLAVASLAAVKLDVDGSFHGHRNLQTSLSPLSPDYYDALRIDLASQQANATRGENSSIYQVSFLVDDVPTTLRLAEIKSFLPFSRDGVVLVGNWNEGFGVLLALDHLNRMHERGHPVLKELIASDPVLSNCNIRFTIELFDGQFSPSTTVQTMTSVVRRRASLASPPATAVIGAHYSSETLPLAIYTGVNHIPQISASATSVRAKHKKDATCF